ncbi:hypothetical protein TRFO_30273 [Tritrichomonas foetus]|uniref:LisH domain-containing protein n=1 Tax=Tritrichomonas foetus TaxID=1144522 RepID=A0A1J4JV09_9EUKA|nr:hypothetical protein TRFO_30273 [Tritrichomonas foetus]|eukprot:OHT02546.1 hypothetical protein TRFO_30273 [Tritrichomonas foetus]
MEFLNEFIDSSTNKIIQDAKMLLQKQKIKENIMEESNGFVCQIVDSMNDKNNSDLPCFPSVQINADDPFSYEYLEFQLVLDYLDSIGCKFAASIFRNESQNISEIANREFIADTLKLRTYDQSPLLVQFIESLR